MDDIGKKLFRPTHETDGIQITIQENLDAQKNTAFESSEEEIIKIPGALVHLIDESSSVQLASGTFSIVKLKQGNNVVAILARVGDEIQWPLAKDETAVKLDESHYFFTLRVPTEFHDGDSPGSSETVLNYGLTIASKGQEKLLKKLDEELDKCRAKDISPEEVKTDEKNWEMSEKSSSAYGATLAPSAVEDYSGSLDRSGKVIKGILTLNERSKNRVRSTAKALPRRPDTVPISP